MLAVMGCWMAASARSLQQGTAAHARLASPVWAKPVVCCVQAVVDASNVPGEYALTILSECAAFPRRLVFFLKGNLVVRRHA